MKNIVVGIDFSNSSLNALKHAIAISLKTQGKLHLVWVKTPSTTNKAAKEEIKQITKKAQAALAELIADCKKEAPKSVVNSIILEGKALWNYQICSKSARFNHCNWNSRMCQGRYICRK
jgi:nucleotide-binding universal stress UspA family protein